jgi:hypothetical protein
MKKYYYKVTTEIDGEECSLVVHNTKAAVKYKVGEWTEAPQWLAKAGYHLLVFNTLRNAKKFLRGYMYIICPHIWRCEVEGKFFILPFQLTGDSLEQGFITPIPGCEFPKGSVMVKKVKLTDLVWGVR